MQQEHELNSFAFVLVQASSTREELTIVTCQVQAHYVNCNSKPRNKFFQRQE